MFHVKQKTGYVQMNIFGWFIELNTLLIGFGVFFGVIFLITLIALILSVKANSKIKKLLRDNKGTDIVDAISKYYEKCNNVEENFQKIIEKIEILESESAISIKKVGSLRYDAFGENNTNLSFTAALLDESDNGFVLNGVYSRESTTTYLKTIKEGKSIFALSDEEMQAIQIAKENYNKKRIKKNLK